MLEVINNELIELYREFDIVKKELKRAISEDNLLNLRRYTKESFIIESKIDVLEKVIVALEIR